MTGVDLNNRAMLAVLHLRAWKATATDREIASQAEAQAGSETGTMQVIKELSPRHLIHPIKSIMRLGRDEHYRMTVPGMMIGQHLLSSAMFEDYVLTQGAIRDQFLEAVKRYIEVYPSIRERAPDRLGTAYRENDFPSVQQIEGYFGYEFSFYPIPVVSNDWRLEGLADSDVSKLRNQVEDNVRKMFNEATRDVFDRCRAILEKMVMQAKNYSTDAPGAMLRDATIEHLKDVASLVSKMNVTGDPLLEQVGREMVKEFSQIEAAELRKSADARSEIASKAQAILARMVKHG